MESNKSSKGSGGGKLCELVSLSFHLSSIVTRRLMQPRPYAHGPRPALKVTSHEQAHESPTSGKLHCTRRLVRRSSTCPLWRRIGQAAPSIAEPKYSIKEPRGLNSGFVIASSINVPSAWRLSVFEHRYQLRLNPGNVVY